MRTIALPHRRHSYEAPIFSVSILYFALRYCQDTHASPHTAARAFPYVDYMQFQADAHALPSGLDTRTRIKETDRGGVAWICLR